MKRTVVCAAMAAASLTVAAQERRPVAIKSDTFNAVVGAPIEAGAMTNTFQYIATDSAFAGKTVKGAPYSATAVTETVQTLADGNRITHASNASVTRDSQGRTRRDQSFPALGPWASEGAAPKMTTINDPVAGVTYTLDDREKTARKLQPKVLLDNATAARVKIEPAAVAGAPMHVSVAGAPAGGNVMFFANAGPGHTEVQPKTEQLGQKTIEGVVADGTRTTIEIPAGAMGNERPIQIVDERWYSQELQTTLMTRHSDPRSGETTFRLTNISRAEPSPLLFEVPADYKVMEGPEGPMRIQFDRKQEPGK